MYTALGSSDLVVVSADDSQFLLAVRQTLIASIEALEKRFGHLFFPQLKGEERELPEACGSPPRIAFVTDLGAAPRIRTRELEDAIAACLERRERFVQSIFQSSTVIFVDSNSSTFEIARAIAQQHFAPIVDKQNEERRRILRRVAPFADDIMLTAEGKVTWQIKQISIVR
jgi:hypothetical protein